MIVALFIISKNQGLTNSLADMNNVLGAKNLLNPIDYHGFTFAGVTSTINSDGTISLSGTATTTENPVITKNWSIDASNLFDDMVGQEVILSDGTDANPYIGLMLNDGNGAQFLHPTTNNGEVKFTISQKPTTYSIYYHVVEGVDYTGVVLKPMIRLASIEDDTHVPYSMTNREMTPYVQSISNPNLLDNPWFTVNQRGITTDTRTEGTTRYTVDRWILRGAPTITVNTDSIVINNSTGTSGHSFYQKIEENIYNKIKGKTVTLSIDAVASASGCMVGMWQGNQTPQAMGYKSIPTTRSIVKSTVKLGNVTATSPFEVLIDTVSGATLTIYSIKLELGTVSTLAMDSAPNYQQELAKCQRYFVRFNPTDSFTAFGAGIYSSNHVFAEVTLPTVLRAKPSVSFSSVRAHSYGRNDVSISSITVNNYINNIVSLKCAPGSGANFVNGDYCEIQLDTNNYLDLSCDL